MDYRSLKRRELQALCKKHNIPANSANSVLADKLSALLNEKQKPMIKQRSTCMKGLIETTEEGEPAASKRQAKKVRFSPSNDLVEYELRSGEKQKDMVTRIKASRKSVAKKVDKSVVDNNTTVESVDDTAQNPVKLTRSRVHLLGKDVVIPNNEKKQSRKGAKGVEKGTDVDKETEGYVHKVTRSKAHTLKMGGGVEREESRQSKRLIRDVDKASESVEGTVATRARVTRSKAQTMMEGGTVPDVNLHVKIKTGKQVETDRQNVEPAKSKEIMDVHVPVRATRSRRQTQKEENGNTVTNPQADKKRTRREMKATDLSSNSSRVAPVDKQEPPKRKSLRTRGVETVYEDEGDKVEVVSDSRVTRSRAPLAMEAPGRKSKNKANKVKLQQLEEPSKDVGKKNVNRRKSVLQHEETEVVLHLEEHVNRPARKNTRRKSVMQKATKMVESPTVGKKQSKGQSGNLYLIEGIEDIENVTRSGKDASETEFKEATIGSPKSRKRRGTPIIEDQITETEYGSLVDKSPKSSTRSAGKSGGKSVAKKQVESSLKKSVSRMKSVSKMNNQSPVENAFKGKSWAIRSGAIISDSSSKKRAKLSGTKQSDSKDHAVNFSKDGTPVAKMASFKLDEEVNEPEVTPAFDKSDRRFTRSAIRSEKKEPSQSAIKEQPIADSQLSLPKVANFEHDPGVNTAPGRITRRGIKHGGNAAGSFSEKVGKKKQTSRSAYKKPFDDAQMALPEVAEVGPNPDIGTKGVSSEIIQPLDVAQMSSPEVPEVGPSTDADTIGVQPEYKQPYDGVQMSSPDVAEVLPNPDSDTVRVGSVTFKEVTGQMLGDLSASESVRLPTEVVENRDPVSGTAIDMECTSLVSGVNFFGEVMEDGGARVEKSTYSASATPSLTENLLRGEQENPLDMQSFDDETPSGKNHSRVRMTSDSIANVAETVPDPVSDGSSLQIQNEDAYVEHGILSKAVNLEISVLESGRSDAKEKKSESAESGSASKELQTDVMIEEPQVSAGKAVLMEESVDISHLGAANKGDNGDDDYNCDSISNDVVSSAVCHESIQDVADDKDESANAQKPLMSEPVSKYRGVADGVDANERDSVARVYDDEPNKNDTPDQITGGNKLHAFAMEEHDTEVDIVTARDSLAEHSELSTGKMDIYSPAINKSEVADDTGKEPAKELECGVVPSTCNDIHDVPILGKSDGEDGSVNAAKESEMASMPTPGYPLLSGSEGVTTNEEHESNTETLPDIDAYDASLLGDDVFSMHKQPEPISKPSSVNTISDQKSFLDIFGAPLIGEGHVLDDGTNVPKELSSVNTPVSGNDVDIECVLDDINDVHDGESGHDQLTSNANPAKDEEDVGGDDFEPAQNESVPVVAEVLAGSHDQESKRMLNVTVDDVLCDMVGPSDSITSKDTPKTLATSKNDDMAVRVDGLEESVLGSNKDVVGDTYDMDAEDDRGNEHSLTESGESFQPKESGGVSLITKESLPMTYKKEESPVDDTDSDTLTTKEDDRNKQEETRNAGTSVDWGDHDFVWDEFEKPVSKDGSADVVGKGKKEDQDSDLQPSARTSSSTEESSGLAAGLFNSVRNLEKDSGNEADEKSNQEVDMLKESAKAADMTRKVFNWSDSSPKSLFATPAASRISCIKDSEEDVVNLANQDTCADSSLKSLFATPVASRISCIKDSQEDVVNLANQDTCADSSLKLLFATPAASRISCIKDSQEDVVNLANQDTYSSLKPSYTTPATTQTSHVKEDASNFANKDHCLSLKSMFTTPASTRTSHVEECKADAVNLTFPAGRSNEDVVTGSHEFNNQWEDDHSPVIDSETHGNTVQGHPENEIYGVPSFEDFGDEQVGGSTDRPGRNTNFEFKGDDQIEQFEFSREAAGKHDLDSSGLKDNSICRGECEKKEETLMKGSETDNDLAFDTGHV